MSSHSSPNCLFCKIVSGTIPSSKVFEDDLTLAFLDINPVNSGHCLVVPKTHSTDLTQMSKEATVAVFSTVQLIGSALKASLAVPAFNLLMNNGKEAGQEVFHSHCHVIPQGEKSTKIPFPSGQKYSSVEEQKRIADSIAASIKAMKPNTE